MKEHKKISEIKLDRNNSYRNMEKKKYRNSTAYENFKRPAFGTDAKGDKA